MKDRSLPGHWTRIGDGCAVRTDSVEIVRDSHYHRSPFIVMNGHGETLNQTIKGGQRRRPRLFKYMDAAAAAADRTWPLFVNHEPAFRLVADPGDWKKPIDAVVPAEKLVAVIKAIHFYTATETTVTVQAGGRFRVKSIGYRMGPAGP